MFILPGGAPPTPTPWLADRSLEGVTHYEVLGVSVSATSEEIRRAYLRQARLHHPDVGGGERPMQALNRAWAVLGSPKRRRAYDRSLTLGRPAPPPSPTFESGPRAGEDVYVGDEPEPDVPTDLRREILLLVPAGVLGLAVACFALSVIM